MSKALLDELALYLRPPGQGIHAVSTGKAELEAFASRYLGAAYDPKRPWRKHLDAVTKLKGPDAVALLAIPHDTGAGIVRGAARGPEAIRAALGGAPCFDLGDVFSVPQLLDDGMHSAAQLKRSRAAVFEGVSPAKRARLPVSPLSMATRALQLLRKINPSLKVLLLGGDHTVAWPAMAALFGGPKSKNRDCAIVHFDAHTDLLPERLGIRYCFATWAYHANELLGRGGRMVQLGIRASAKPREHWEKALGVRQLWAEECLRHSPSTLADAVVAHLREKKLKRVYVSNDLDGTDARWAAACGTPEPGGLTPEHVLAVIDRLRAERFEILGADVVELAPGLSLDREASRVSIETATRYVRAEIELLKASPS